MIPRLARPTGRHTAAPVRAVSILADVRRYAVASALSFGMVLAVSAGLHELAGASETLAVALAMAIAFAVNFTLLRRWVFAGQVAPAGRQALETAITSVTFRALEYGVFLALNLGAGVDYLLATAAALCLSAAGKFTIYRGVIFNPARGGARPEADPAAAERGREETPDARAQPPL
jgi:putative flippase GtrA